MKALALTAFLTLVLTVPAFATEGNGGSSTAPGSAGANAAAAAPAGANFGCAQTVEHTDCAYREMSLALPSGGRTMDWRCDPRLNTRPDHWGDCPDGD